VTEIRAKYTQDEIDALGKKGQAFKDADGSYSYPIADEDDLKNAIRAVGRGNADHDAIRKYVIKRAKALGSSDLIPDNWNADGSLKETNGVWSTQEQRETFNDTYTALTGAVCDGYGGDYCSAWVQDFTDSQVIFYAQGELWADDYSLEDGGAVTLGGEPQRVRPVTEYVPRSASDAEWRKRRADEAKGTLERRQFDATGMEIREADDGTITLTGYASVTETPYEVGFYTETIKRGAFKRTLREDPDVQLLVNHEGLPLARTKSGTLRLSENDRGLFVEADLDPEDPDVQALVRKMKRGDIDQMSFAFQATAQDWNEDYSERAISSVSIHRGDVSVVNMAANPAATASISTRDIGSLLLEVRAGKTLSTSTMETLSQVLKLVATADDAVDEAQPILADLMGVPNPDADETDEPAERSADDRLRVLRARRNRDTDDLYLLRDRKAA